MGAPAGASTGSPGEGVWGGFTFNPAPLVFAGQSVGAPSLQFSDPVAIAQVDQGSQAYAFTNQLTTAAFDFVGNANASVQGFDQPLFSDVLASETQFGNSLTASISTEANALATAAKGVSSGAAGGGGGGFLGSIMGLIGKLF